MRITTLPNSTCVNALAVIYALPELPKDFKRVLRVQFKEFLHQIDEVGEQAGTCAAPKRALAS